MHRILMIGVLVCVAAIAGCETRRPLVTLRIVDRGSGQPLAGAEVVRWYNDMVGLSFSMEKTITAAELTGHSGVVRFQEVGRYDHFDINKAGFQRAIVGSFTRKPQFLLGPEEGELTLDSDGAYRVPLHPALPPRGAGPTQPGSPPPATQPKGP